MKGICGGSPVGNHCRASLSVRECGGSCRIMQETTFRGICLWGEPGGSFTCQGWLGGELPAVAYFASRMIEYTRSRDETA
jgi:hypothetical protein